MANKQQVAEIRRRLEVYGGLLRKLEIQKERLARLESASVSVTTAPTGMPHGGGSSDRFGERLEKKEKLEADIEKTRARADAALLALGEMLRHLDDEEECLLLAMRYEDMESWEDITQVLFCRCGDYVERFDKYLKRTYRLHGSALAHLADMILPAAT